ncbi:MAG: hypothetical protein WCT24_00445 [Patescibacteria group bacterium]
MASIATLASFLGTIQKFLGISAKDGLPDEFYQRVIDDPVFRGQFVAWAQVELNSTVIAEHDSAPAARSLQSMIDRMRRNPVADPETRLTIPQVVWVLDRIVNDVKDHGVQSLSLKSEHWRRWVINMIPELTFDRDVEDALNAFVREFHLELLDSRLIGQNSRDLANMGVIQVEVVNGITMYNPNLPSGSQATVASIRRWGVRGTTPVQAVYRSALVESGNWA